MTDLNHAWFTPLPHPYFYHVCYCITFRLSLNLKLIKDTQQHSLLTVHFAFPFISNPFIYPSVLQWSLSLRIQADGRGACCLMPGGQYRREYGKERGTQRERARCTPAVMAQQRSLLRPVIIQPWPFTELLLENHVDFSRSLTSLIVDHDEKSPDVFLLLSSFPHYTLKLYSLLT